MSRAFDEGKGESTNRTRLALPYEDHHWFVRVLFFILYLTINNNKSFVRKVDLQNDFDQAMEMKQLELSVLQFKHQVLQASS